MITAIIDNAATPKCPDVAQLNKKATIKYKPYAKIKALYPKITNPIAINSPIKNTVGNQ